MQTRRFSSRGCGARGTSSSPGGFGGGVVPGGLDQLFSSQERELLRVLMTRSVTLLDTARKRRKRAAKEPATPGSAGPGPANDIFSVPSNTTPSRSASSYPYNTTRPRTSHNDDNPPFFTPFTPLHWNTGRDASFLVSALAGMKTTVPREEFDLFATDVGPLLDAITKTTTAEFENLDLSDCSRLVVGFARLNVKPKKFLRKLEKGLFKKLAAGLVQEEDEEEDIGEERLREGRTRHDMEGSGSGGGAAGGCSSGEESGLLEEQFVWESSSKSPSTEDNPIDEAAALAVSLAKLRRLLETAPITDVRWTMLSVSLVVSSFAQLSLALCC